MHRRDVVLALAGLLAGIGGTALGQPVGTFRWQLQPFCNVVTVAITQNGAVYRLEGTDDQCGAGAGPASVTGTAFPNRGGTIGFGLNIVTAPGGRPVHVDAAISLGNFSGTWRDSAGATGAFVLTPGAGSGGIARPLPSAVPSTIVLRPDGGFAAAGAFGVGSSPASGPGVRMMWHAGKAAFRAGEVTGAQWNDVSVGAKSVATGHNTTASAFASTAMGARTTASGDFSTALGNGTTATGLVSTATGNGTFATGDYSAAFGNLSIAAGSNAVAGGNFSIATGNSAMAFGNNSRADGNGSVALGTGAVAAGSGAFAFGDSNAGAVTAGLNQFKVRASNGVFFYSNAAQSVGVLLAASGAQWLGLSDVRSKHHFRDLDGDDVLRKIAAMPVTEWSYRAQDASIRHIGPTAQDFHAAFGLGEDPLRIGTLDADGVALAGLKAVEARTRHLAGRLEAFETENASLRTELDRARAHVASLMDDNAAIRDRLARLAQLLGKQ